MSTAIEIDGKKLHPIKDVVKKVSYSRDYITRLAREGKITATSVGRQWFVELESVSNYAELSKQEAELRKKHLSEERKMEQEVRVAVDGKKDVQTKRAKSVNVRATVAASFVLGLGLLSGWATNFLINPNYSPQSQVANTSELSTTQVLNTVPVVVEKDSNLAVASVSAEESKSENYQETTMDIRPISDDVENGVLLLPHGSVNVSPEEMFSDDVTVLTSADGTQMVVRVDSEGRPIGNVIPFVSVPVNHTEI